MYIPYIEVSGEKNLFQDVSFLSCTRKLQCLIVTQAMVRAELAFVCSRHLQSVILIGTTASIQTAFRCGGSTAM